MMPSWRQRNTCDMLSYSKTTPGDLLTSGRNVDIAKMCQNQRMSIALRLTPARCQKRSQKADVRWRYVGRHPRRGRPGEHLAIPPRNRSTPSNGRGPAHVHEIGRKAPRHIACADGGRVGISFGGASFIFDPCMYSPAGGAIRLSCRPSGRRAAVLYDVAVFS